MTSVNRRLLFAPSVRVVAQGGRRRMIVTAAPGDDCDVTVDAGPVQAGSDELIKLLGFILAQALSDRVNEIRLQFVDGAVKMRYSIEPDDPLQSWEMIAPPAQLHAALIATIAGLSVYGPTGEMVGTLDVEVSGVRAQVRADLRDGQDVRLRLTRS